MNREVRDARPLHRRCRLGLAALMTRGGAVASVGYIDQTQVQVVLSGPNVVRCNRVGHDQRPGRQHEERPARSRNQIVNWSLSGAIRRRRPQRRQHRDEPARPHVGDASFGPVAGARTVARGGHGHVPVDHGPLRRRPAADRPRARRPGSSRRRSATRCSCPTCRDRTSSAPTEPLPATGVRLERLGIDLPLVEGDGAGRAGGCRGPLPGDGVAGPGLQHVRLRARSRGSLPRALAGPHRRRRGGRPG